LRSTRFLIAKNLEYFNKLKLVSDNQRIFINIITLLLISFGFSVSMVFSVEYLCEGNVLFPKHYGSPFIFKKTSLDSAFIYYYSLSGMLYNLIFWGVIFLGSALFLRKLRKRILYYGIINVIYKSFVFLFIVISISQIVAFRKSLSQSFDVTTNYWNWEFEEQVSRNELRCFDEWKFEWEKWKY
jgi:hypothetical protein